MTHPKSILTIKQKCRECHNFILDKEKYKGHANCQNCKGTGQLETEIYALNDFEIAETITKLNKRGVK